LLLPGCFKNWKRNWKFLVWKPLDKKDCFKTKVKKVTKEKRKTQKYEKGCIKPFNFDET
jgi:hypothetical protein